MSVSQQIKQFILQNYLFTDDPTALGDDDSFLGRGIIDSTGILEVIHFLGDEFGITVEDREMTPDNLDSVNRLVAFVERKRGQAPGRASQ